ncbi:MAG TPA: hypothetical protein VKN76_08415 [Kiloniellaceae bacterium]|nr:hypothetical protein [Kiloniellaceae bacterium]
MNEAAFKEDAHRSNKDFELSRSLPALGSMLPLAAWHRNVRFGSFFPLFKPVARLPFRAQHRTSEQALLTTWRS